MPKPEHYRARLTGKVAIVTGSGSQGDGVGIGKAIAAVLAGEGARVCLVDLSAERLEPTRSLIAAEGGEAFSTVADVTRAVDCERVLAEVLARYGGADILINNVGIAAGPSRLEDLDEAAWDQVIAVNVKSALLMSRSAIASMRQRGGGAIVNISSIASLRAYGTLAYGPSKAAMNSLTAELALIYGPQGIRVNTVAPGHVMTPLAMGLLGESARERRRKAGPLAIEGDAWDIALAVLFLASDEARFITGAMLPVDGGVIEVGSLAAYDLLTCK
ncbi:MAG TPA: SDR family oxidoreductase [Steroidobacteraceae bacterium]|nr:SDR family oxidoreductase [Steroidobacteraceae bacterium]